MWIIKGFQQALDPHFLKSPRRFYWILLHLGSFGLGRVFITVPELSGRRLDQVLKKFRGSQVRMNGFVKENQDVSVGTSRRSLWIPLGFQRFLVGSYGFKGHLRVSYVGQCLHEGVPVVLKQS